MKNRLLKLISLDVLASAFSLYIAFILRFEFSIPQQFIGILVQWLPLFILAQIVVFNVSGLYARIWRYTSLFDLLAIIRTVAVSCAASFIIVLFLMGSTGYPRSVLVLYFFFNIVFTSTIRLSVRVYYSHFHEYSILKTGAKKKLLLVGAGKTGEKIAREILTTPRSQYTVIGFADDDPEKLGGMLHGLKIFCSINNIPDLTVPFDEVLITAPRATGEQMRRIVDVCKKAGKHYKTVPGLDELIDKDVSLAAVRDVSYVDLLGRAEVKLDLNSIEDIIKGKRVYFSTTGVNELMWFEFNSDGTASTPKNTTDDLIKYKVDGLNVHLTDSEDNQSTATFQKAELNKGDNFTLSENGAEKTLTILMVE